MGRGGHGRMAGMAGGIAWGTIWGALVGGLVLSLAALLLDLGTGAPPEAPGNAVPPSDAPDAGPALLMPGAASGPPTAGAPPASRPTGAPRSLLPRPAQPVLPRLVAAPDMPVMIANVPPRPASVPVAPPVGSMAVDVRVSPPLGIGDGVSIPAPRATAPEFVARAVSGPRLSVAPPPDAVPDGPSAPKPLIDASAAPAIAPPPVPDDAAPFVSPPDVSTARSAVPVPVTSPSAGRRPQPPGPRVAFVLDGTTDGPVPDWIGASATADASGGLGLAGGGAVVTDTGAASEEARLAYARLDGPDAADATALARIALRARRDGAVTVLVAPDPALWDRIGAWLDGPARDLVPVDAASLPR